MKKLMIIGAALLMTAATYGQGQFNFNTRDPNSNPVNSIKFAMPDGTLVSDAIPNATVEVGTMAGNVFTALGTMPLNRAAGGPAVLAGFPNPAAAVFNAPAGTTTIAYRAYANGTSYDTAKNQFAPVTVTQMFGPDGNPTAIALPTDPIAPPPELVLGTAVQTLALVPEPTTLALGLLGLGTLLAIRRRS